MSRARAGTWIWMQTEIETIHQSQPADRSHDRDIVREATHLVTFKAGVAGKTASRLICYFIGEYNMGISRVTAITV